MNLRNVSFYSAILLFVLVFGLSMQNVVLDFQNSEKVVLSSASIDYMNKLTANMDLNNFDSVDSRTEKELQEDTMFLSGEDEGSSSISDNLANMNVFKSIQQKIINPLKFIYSCPSFILTLLGLPLEPFTDITTVINLVIYIGLITMIIANLK